MRHLLALIACGTPDPTVAVAPVVEAPAPVARPADKTERYVQASSLNLRDGPKGKVIGKLAINNPVMPIQVLDGFVEVRTGNDKTGWVGEAFLGPERLTVRKAVEMAGKGDDPLSWWQRAAAIDPSSKVLEGLRDAYTAEGDSASAEVVARQLEWPHHVLLVVTPFAHEDKPGVFVEWGQQGYQESPRDIPHKEWGGLGLTRAAPFFVLPDQGPAVRATPNTLTREIGSECSGEVVDTLNLKASLPKGRTALAVARGRMPKTWKDDIERTDEAQARAALIAKAEEILGKPAPLEMVAHPKGWAASARKFNGNTNELGMELWNQVRMTYDGEVHVLETLEDSAQEGSLIGVRDLFGDGPVWIFRNGCEASARSPDGKTRKWTTTRCCGC